MPARAAFRFSLLHLALLFAALAVDHCVFGDDRQPPQPGSAEDRGQGRRNMALLLVLLAAVALFFIMAVVRTGAELSLRTSGPSE